VSDAGGAGGSDVDTIAGATGIRVDIAKTSEAWACDDEQHEEDAAR
jgi:hypothetical protein